MTKPMRQDLILRILGEDLFSGTLQKTTNNLKKQSQSLGGYFTNINKHYQGLIKNAKNLLQNGKNGSVSIIDPLYAKNTKEAEKNYKKAEQAYKVFQDRRITSAKEYSNTIAQINKKIQNGIKGQQKLLQQGLTPSSVFKVYDKQTKGYIEKQLGSLIQERLKGSALSKINSNLQTLFTGVMPAKPVKGIIKSIESALNIPNIRDAKKIFKVLSPTDENYAFYQGLSNKATRNNTIAKEIGKFSNTYKLKLLSNLPSYALYNDLEKYATTGTLPVSKNRAKAVKQWLTAQGFTVEKSWKYFNASNKIGSLQKQETELRALYPRLSPIKQQYEQAESAYLKAIDEQAKNTQTITRKDITQGQRDLAKTLINFASPKQGNYFNKLTESVFFKSGEDRTRLLNSIKAQSQEYAYYANGVMQMFGLDPKSGRWYSDKEGYSKVNFGRHLKEVAKEKNISVSDQRLLRSLFNTVTKQVIDPANNIREDLKGEVGRKAYLKQFKSTDQKFIQNLKTPTDTNIKQINQYKEQVRQLTTAQGHILNTLNTYNGIKLNQDFKQEDLDKALKNSNITYKNQKDRVQELGRAYLMASNKRETLNKAIQEGEKLKLFGYDENQIKTLNTQSKDILKDVTNIQKSAPYQQLLKGNAVTANDFKNAKIAETTADLKNSVQGYVRAFSRLGINNVSAGIRPENLDRNITLFREGEVYNKLTPAERDIFDRNVKNLQSGFTPVNNAYRAFTAASEVQSRNRSKALATPEQQAKQLQRNRLDDINQTNMSLYALSHAFKAVEVPLQQAYDYGRGSIDEYVNFQSAMVGVAKLLPSLRDKDTLLVNKKFEDFRQGVLKLTETLPMSGVELAMASESASRLGVTDPNQIRKVVETGTKLGVAFGMSPDDVTKQVVKIANAKGIDLNKSDSLSKVMEFADAINYLDDHTAASGREIINFTKKAVQTAEGVKMDTKDVSAFGATLVSLGISADSANTGFKNLMTVLQTGPRNQKKGTEYLEKSGYSVKELTTLFKKNPTETAVAFIKRLNKLRNAPAGADAAAIVRFAFGQMSSQAIMALVNNPEVLEKYLAMARQNSKGWTEKEFQARQKNDPAVRFKLLDNKLKTLQIDIGEVLMPIADDFIKTIKDFSNTLQPFIKEHPEFARAGANVGMGMLGLTKLASFGADTAIIVNNLRNFEGLDKIITKLGGWGQVTGALGIAGLTAVGVPILSAWVGTEIDKKNAQIDAREEGVKGTTAERKQRTTTEHGSVFQEQKLLKLKASLNKQGFDFVRGEDGRFKLITDKGSEVKFGMGASDLGAFYTGQQDTRYLESSKGTFVESSNPELFGTIDEAERLFYSLEAKRTREGIAPRIEGIKNIDKSNIKAYNELRNKQINKQSERAQAEIDLKVITDELDKANKNLDLEKIGKYQQKLDQATSKLKKIKESQNYLYDLLEYTDLSKPNSIQDNINKKDDIRKAKNKELQDGFKFAQNILNNTTQGTPALAIQELKPKKEMWTEARDSLNFWMSDKPKQLGYTQQQIDEGRKKYKKANDNLYNVNARLKAIEGDTTPKISKNITPRDAIQMFGLYTTTQEDTIFGKNRQAILDTINQKTVVYNDTVGKTSLNTKTLYGVNKETTQSLSTMQTTGTTAFEGLNKGIGLTNSTIGTLLLSLNAVQEAINKINSTTISPKVQMPNIPGIKKTPRGYNKYVIPKSEGSIFNLIEVED